MKRIITMIILVLGMTVITSCEKDDPKPNNHANRSGQVSPSDYPESGLVSEMYIVNSGTLGPHHRVVESDARITGVTSGFFDPDEGISNPFNFTVHHRLHEETIYIHNITIAGDTMSTREVIMEARHKYQY